MTTTKKKPHDYIPQPMVQFDLWQNNFMTVLQIPVNLALIGIPTGTGSPLAALLALQATYATSYLAAPPHGNATKSARTTRNDDRKLYKSGPGGIRKTVAEYIRSNTKVTNALKIELGLLAPAGTHTITTLRAEVDYPNIQVKSNSPGTVTFTIHDKDSPKSTGKPDNIHHALVEYIVQLASLPLPTNPDACNKHFEPQKMLTTLNVGMASSSMRLCGFGCWVDDRGVLHYFGPVFNCIIT
jgi:hypothetical protein